MSSPCHGGGEGSAPRTVERRCVLSLEVVDAETGELIPDVSFLCETDNYPGTRVIVRVRTGSIGDPRSGISPNSSCVSFSLPNVVHRGDEFPTRAPTLPPPTRRGNDDRTRRARLDSYLRSDSSGVGTHPSEPPLRKA